MNKHNRLVIALLITLMSSLMLVSAVSAHNAGHIILPSGECLNVGSSNEGPFVPEANPNRNNIIGGPDYGRLDLLPGPGDQYGARYAAVQGNSAVLPGGCP